MCASMRPLMAPRKCPQRFRLPLTLSSQRAPSQGLLPDSSSMKRSHLEGLQLAMLEQMLMLCVIAIGLMSVISTAPASAAFKPSAAVPAVSAAGLSYAYL